MSTGTFEKIPNLKDDNLWHATDSQLAYAVGMAIRRANRDEARKIINATIRDFEALMIRLMEPDVQDLDSNIVFSERTKGLLLSGDVCDDESDLARQTDHNNSCVLCDEDSHITLFSCCCHYCYGCLSELICHGLCSEENWPPRCCQPLWGSDIVLAGRPYLFHLYSQMALEFKVPRNQRVYCADPQCKAWVGVKDSRVIAHKCGACDLRTCSRCLDEHHPNEPCQPQEIDSSEDVWAVMDASGAVNCPKCGYIMAHGGGCNTMVCPICDVPFCYICGHPVDVDCHCPPAGSLERRIPMAERPGVKPERFTIRRRPQPSANKRPRQLRIGRELRLDEPTMWLLRKQGMYWVPDIYR